jgi:hypothetical protein
LIWLKFSSPQPAPHADYHRPSTGSFIPFRESVRIGVYRGNVVAVKQINKKSVDLNRTILKELNSVRSLFYETGIHRPSLVKFKFAIMTLHMYVFTIP